MALDTMVMPPQCGVSPRVSRCSLAAIHAAAPRTPALCCAILFCRRWVCSKTRLARALGLSRYQLSQILAEKRPVTTENGYEAGIRVGGTAQSWTDMQTAHDQWRSR